jgi:mannose-6-phosphate isomerase-like protein (cupin superfamily)
MAVLRTEGGLVYTRYEAINDLIGPTTVAPVAVPTGIDRLIEPESLSSDAVRELLDHADPGLDAARTAAGWPPPLAQVLWAGMPEELHDVVAGFAAPHTNPVDEVHHVVDGAVVFGVVDGDGAQFLVVVQPGDALTIHEGTEHWSVLTADRRVKTFLYLSRPPGYRHEYTGTAVRVR